MYQEVTESIICTFQKSFEKNGRNPFEKFIKYVPEVKKRRKKLKPEKDDETMHKQSNLIQDIVRKDQCMEIFKTFMSGSDDQLFED